MSANIFIDLLPLEVALIAAVPATIAAWATFKTNRLVRTNHGKTIGEHVERVGDNLNELNRAFDRHTYDDLKRFDEVLTLLKDPNTPVPVVLAPDTKDS